MTLDHCCFSAKKVWISFFHSLFSLFFAVFWIIGTDSFAAQLLASISIAGIDSLFFDSFAAQSPQVCFSVFSFLQPDFNFCEKKKTILFVYDLMLITMILLPIPLSSAFGSYSANNCAYCIVLNLLMSIAFDSFYTLQKPKLCRRKGNSKPKFEIYRKEKVIANKLPYSHVQLAVLVKKCYWGIDPRYLNFSFASVNIQNVCLCIVFS